jgi:tetratricopeptide (TPR) repeat protein
MTCITSRAGHQLLLAVTVALGLSAAPRISWGQTTSLTPQQKQEMKAHYDKATRAYDVGKYNEAVEEYQKAYEIGGDPAMLYNIGQAYRLGDQPAEAVRFYRRYLQRSPNARNRDDVERRITDLEKLAEARRQSAPAPLPPPVAANPAPALPVPTPSQPPIVTPQPTTPPPLMPGPTPPPSVVDDGDGHGRRIAAYILLGVGVVGAGVAGYEAKVARDKSDKISSQSRMGNVVFDPAVETNGKRANTIAIVSGVASAAAFIGGAILLLTDHSAAASSPEAAPRPAGAAVVPVLSGGVLGASAAWSF